MAMVNLEDQNEIIDDFWRRFRRVAVLQGKMSYYMMSILYVNPDMAENFLEFKPARVLFANMLYGIGVMLYSRPAMRPISSPYRLILSVLGTLMFNHSSLLFFEWLSHKMPDHPVMLTMLSFSGARVMMVHLLAYLYHVDLGYLQPEERRALGSNFDALYL